MDLGLLPTDTMLGFVTKAWWRENPGGKGFVFWFWSIRFAHSHSRDCFFLASLLRPLQWAFVSPEPTSHAVGRFSSIQLWWQRSSSQHLTATTSPWVVWEGKAPPCEQLSQACESTFPAISASEAPQQTLCHSVGHSHALRYEVCISVLGNRGGCFLSALGVATVPYTCYSYIS